MSTIEIPDSAVSTDRADKERLLDRFLDPRRSTKQASGDSRRHTDADSIRRHFGVPPWDADRFEYETVVPDCIESSWDPPGRRIAGGSDLLVRGKPGSGKSTLANYLSARELEVNGAAVVWRASTSRSEWLPLAPWARLCLPSSASTIDVRLESKDPTEPTVELDVDDLERIVREVVYYDDPVDLNHSVLQNGAFHVVYPDPSMTGCQAIYEGSDERTVDPPARGNLFDPEDPANHWWFAFLLARVEFGPYHWLAWFCDEIGDIMPQEAGKDSFGSLQKIDLLKDSWVDLRKFGVSVYGFCHDETDVHEKIRRKLRWRCQLPGMANPTSAGDTVGFGSIPMNNDLTSDNRPGEALLYTQTNFESFRWADMSRATNHNLTIKVS